MKNLKFRMWDFEAQIFEYNLDIYECYCDGAVEYQQFTGFLDSDGTEIYSGDILQWEEHQSWEEGGGTTIGIYIVKWDENRGQWMLHDPFNSETHEMHDTRYEYIVGNIMENKALLPCEDEVD